MSNPDDESTGLAEAERQLERLSAYAQTALGRMGLRLHELERMLYSVLELLLAKRVLSADEVAATSAALRDELIVRGEVPERLVALRVDAADAPAGARVDCAARMHVCHAVCCKLDFALSAGEVEDGVVKWDLGRPYFVRRGADGRCHHNDRATGACGVYGQRPGVCRAYSCADDHRIWKDFGRMVLNAAWLDEHLSPARPHLARVLMQRPS